MSCQPGDEQNARNFAWIAPRLMERTSTDCGIVGAHGVAQAQHDSTELSERPCLQLCTFDHVGQAQALPAVWVVVNIHERKQPIIASPLRTIIFRIVRNATSFTRNYTYVHGIC